MAGFLVVWFFISLAGCLSVFLFSCWLVVYSVVVCFFIFLLVGCFFIFLLVGWFIFFVGCLSVGLFVCLSA